MDSFLMQFSMVVLELNRLLGCHFTPKSKSYKSNLGQSLHSILVYHNSDNSLDRDLELSRLIMLTKHLNELKSYQESLFNYYKKELLKFGDNDNYFGIRFEINIASSLIRKKIIFNKQESPDFMIDYYSKQIGLECGSCRIRKTTDDVDFNYKLSSIILEKGGKDYCSLDNALFIDITNLYHTSVRNKNMPDTEEIRKVVQNELDNNRYGAVLLFIYSFEGLVGNYKFSYIRVDNPFIDDILISFLNQYYRFDGYSPTGIVGFPREG